MVAGDLPDPQSHGVRGHVVYAFQALRMSMVRTKRGAVGLYFAKLDHSRSWSHFEDAGTLQFRYGDWLKPNAFRDGHFQRAQAPPE